MHRTMTFSGTLQYIRSGFQLQFNHEPLTH